MRTRLHSAAVFVLYQLSLFAGILLLPVALALRQVGLTLPIHRAVDRFGEAYERHSGQRV